MEIVRRVTAMREIGRQARARGLRIGFVPTLGYLHEGHLALMRKMNEASDVVVVSIFVNPTQFGPGDDFARYPRDLTRDADLCIREGIDYLFTPQADDIYPPGSPVFVDVPDLAKKLEGASRPGHFRGVATVVLKLLHVVQPHVAAFGQKDAQQVALVQRLVRDLLLDIEIAVVPTVRDEDGLALSSRNVLLAPDERSAAAAIPRAIAAARHVVNEGQVEPAEILEAVREVLTAQALVSVDYVELVDPQNFDPLSRVTGEALLVIAVRVGETRLIDNAVLKAG